MAQRLDKSKVLPTTPVEFEYVNAYSLIEMPPRLEIFVNNSVYHIFSRTTDEKPLFSNYENGDMLRETIRYYRSSKARVSFSKLKTMEKNERSKILKEASLRKYFRVDILAYCFMPTHFHLLIEQKMDKGIPKFASDVLNSFAKYYNTKHERKGPLFLPRFKAVRITTDEQLVHVSRYIHLNPYSGGLIKDSEALIRYEWSSLKDYVKGETGSTTLANSEIILAFFNGSSKRYRDFVLSNAEYQRTLEYAKHAQSW